MEGLWLPPGHGLRGRPWKKGKEREVGSERQGQSSRGPGTGCGVGVGRQTSGGQAWHQ